MEVQCSRNQGRGKEDESRVSPLALCYGREIVECLKMTLLYTLRSTLLFAGRKGSRPYT